MLGTKEAVTLWLTSINASFAVGISNHLRPCTVVGLASRKHGGTGTLTNIDLSDILYSEWLRQDRPVTGLDSGLAVVHSLPSHMLPIAGGLQSLAMSRKAALRMCTPNSHSFKINMLWRLQTSSGTTSASAMPPFIQCDCGAAELVMEQMGDSVLKTTVLFAPEESDRLAFRIS